MEIINARMDDVAIQSKLKSNEVISKFLDIFCTDEIILFPKRNVKATIRNTSGNCKALLQSQQMPNVSLSNPQRNHLDTED